MINTQVKIVVGAIGAVALLIFSLLLIKISTVHGNEIGVKETWNEGVLNDPLPNKTYFLFPGFTQKIYTYKISQEVYVMNDNKNDPNNGRDLDAYLVQSKEGQDMHISMAIQWRRDPLKIVELHKTVHGDEEELIIRPELMRIVKDAATVYSAIEAYSGDGLVKLQTDIQTALNNSNGELRKRGIIVDNFVIQGIRLDPSYVDQIKSRQVAVQERLKNIEQTKAAEAAAGKAKAEAQANYEKMVVEAERDKQVGILAAQKEAEMLVLGAKANKDKTVFAAQAEADSGKLRAEGIKAVGAAEAEATKLKLMAYSVPGAESFIKLGVAESMAKAYSGVRGFVPEKMGINVMSDNFNKGVSLLVDPQNSRSDSTH